MADRMRLVTERDSPEVPTLHIDGHAFELDENGEIFEVTPAAVKNLKLSDIPLRAAIRLCDRIIGSRELAPRSPDVIFSRVLSRRNRKGERSERYVARASIAVFWPHDTDPRPQELREHLDRESARILDHLKEIRAKVGLRSARRECYEDIAYVEIELSLPDQPILDGEVFVGELESALVEGLSRRLLFVCHASEDAAFVESLVQALDSRALYAWYDRREIVVGDSIVDKINEGLAEARYLVVVLSRRSVEKPWVKRELNATVMRQLNAAEIKVLPALLEDCKIPPLLADIRYADFRSSFDLGLSELLSALRGAAR
jgi:hypothetical protein